VTTLDNINAVHDVILEDRRIGLKRIANISYERLFHVVHDDLGMMNDKIIYKVVPHKCPNADYQTLKTTSKWL
jgi:hypothetical protein